MNPDQPPPTVQPRLTEPPPPTDRPTPVEPPRDRRPSSSTRPPPTTDETLRTFVDFFRDRGHQRIAGSSLLPPPGDPVLFTTSGMHPLTRYLEGTPHPQGRRLVDVQRCLRTTDLDEVGDRTHLTLFEMLGSWSLGDYPGDQSLRWGYELLVDGFGIRPERLHVTVFGGDGGDGRDGGDGGDGGDGQVGPDTRSQQVWADLGVPVELTGDENWWSNGPTGPCGTDSEMFVWTGPGPPRSTPSLDPGWMELWNHVTIGYRRYPDGRLEPLPIPGIDTGMGLERLLMTLQGKDSVHECDVFEPWTTAVHGLWSLDERSSRLVVDHLRAAVTVIGDGVRPANTGRGYVLRRLVRRVLTRLWRTDPASTLLDLPLEPLIHTGRHFGQQVDVATGREVLLSEERRFADLVRRGRPQVERRRSTGPLTGEDFAYLAGTHGLPPDLVRTLLGESDG